MHFTPDGPPALPSWINGHAFLSVTQGFFDLADPATGKTLRRIPLSGADEAAAATLAATAALPGWSALPVPARRALLAALGKSLERYFAHFTRLLREETGWDETAAQAEIRRGIAALQAEENEKGEGGLTVFVTEASHPFAALIESMVPTLAAGGTVIIKPSPQAPGTPYALCELSARAAWPPGVLNIVQGDETAVEGLRAQAGVTRITPIEPDQ